MLMKVKRLLSLVINDREAYVTARVITFVISC